MNKYPRPQLVRNNYQSLDGKWLVNDLEVIVPSCLQDELLTYIKTFKFKKINDRTILHFEGVDQIAEVYLNDHYLGKHIGGYIPFSFEVSDYLKEGNNILKVIVTDHLDHTYPYGKQRKDRGGMWYTPCSGIWKSVWLEQVPTKFIESIKITPDLKGVDLDIKINDNNNIINKKQRIDIENPILWTFDNPHLYYQIIKEDKDEVQIYYGLRTIEIKNINGINRVCLNNKPIFIHGVLDQGYFNPGILTVSDDESYKKDVELVKSLGFNTIRKHIKIEAEQFYYECDKQGILVMQDMVNSGDYNFIRDTALGTIGLKLNDKKKLDERTKFFIEHCKQTLVHLYNHPSIIIYTIFNEGWGQFNSDEMYDMCKNLDKTRLYDSTSGWFAQNKNDFDSEHIYFRLKKLKPKVRPLLISECGGYSLNIDSQNNSYGYGKCKSKEELTSKIEKLYQEMIIPAIDKGCCGSIYTQLSDVEDEINGFVSYDRKTLKVIPERISEISKQLRIK